MAIVKPKSPILNVSLSLSCCVLSVASRNKFSCLCEEERKCTGKAGRMSARALVWHTQIQEGCLCLPEYCSYVSIQFVLCYTLRHLNDFGVFLPKSHNVVAICCLMNICMHIYNSLVPVVISCTQKF